MEFLNNWVEILLTVRTSIIWTLDTHICTNTVTFLEWTILALTLFAVLAVELVHNALSLAAGGGAVQSHHTVTMTTTQLLQHIQHLTSKRNF